MQAIGQHLEILEWVLNLENRCETRCEEEPDESVQAGDKEAGRRCQKLTPWVACHWSGENWVVKGIGLNLTSSDYVEESALLTHWFPHCSKLPKFRYTSRIYIYNTYSGSLKHSLYFFFSDSIVSYLNERIKATRQKPVVHSSSIIPLCLWSRIPMAYWSHHGFSSFESCFFFCFAYIPSVSLSNGNVLTMDKGLVYFCPLGISRASTE